MRVGLAIGIRVRGEQDAELHRGSLSRPHRPRAFASAAAEASVVATARNRPYIGAMSSTAQMAEVAALVGDPARANMLSALFDGRSLTATELAYAANVSPPTASGHLAKLLDARLVLLVKQGRHRYYRLAGPDVGHMLEAIATVAAGGPPRYRPLSKKEQAMRQARLCYDHMAGVLAVRIAERLAAREFLILGNEAGEVTPAGVDFLSGFGVDLSSARAKRRTFCRPCVDLTERRPHIGGAVGAALAGRCLELNWIERMRDNRAVTVTPAGRDGFRETFGISL
jgi:DNA-binding transcriptional ArsR family regulator